jgi:hypothetical protein
VDTLTQQLQQLKAQVQFWEHRYEHREPRPEDVKLIDKLSKKLEAAKETASKAVEDMQFYKLELVNRETSYNKVFSSNFNVGVMTVGKGGAQVVPQQSGVAKAAEAAAERERQEKKERKREKKERKAEEERLRQQQAQTSQPPQQANQQQANQYPHQQHASQHASQQLPPQNQLSGSGRLEFPPLDSAIPRIIEPRMPGSGRKAVLRAANADDESEETRSLVMERPKHYSAAAHQGPATFGRRLTLE